MRPERDAAGFGVRLSERQGRLLVRLHDLLLERAVPLGLVGERDAGRLYERHVLDSLAAAAAFEPSDRLAYDLGSGAGLPGLVLAIALPGCRFVLVEPRRRRAGFLELAAERLGLGNVSVAVARAEDLGEGEGDVVTARAFAPLERSWRAAFRLLRPGGRLVYFAGRGLRDPLAAAASVAAPEPPGEISLLRVLESAPPLVIMARM